MNLLTLGDMFLEMEFWGQKGCTLRVVYAYRSVVSPNLPVQSDVDFHFTCVQNVIWPPECTVIVGFMIHYILCRIGEVVKPIYPSTWGTDFNPGHKALTETVHLSLVKGQRPR